MTKARIFTSDALEGLAARIGVESAVLVGEIARYNGHVESGEDRDYEKSGQFLMPVGTAPFYAAAGRPATVNVTACDLRADAAGRVLNDRGAEIPGLFAAGECTGGVLGVRYMGSRNGMASALTMGRVAGESAGRSATADA